MTNERFPDFTKVDLNRLFDDKIAVSESYRYDGEKAGEAWRRRVRGYWISRCPDLLPILDFAESFDDQELTIETLAREASSYRWMTELDIKRLGELIWGFLNTCLHGKAHECFESTPELHGFDAWRRIIQHIHQGAEIRLGTLRRAVKHPPAIARLEDVATGITRFEGIIKAYRDAGGTAPHEVELKNDLLETLPDVIREQLMWRATQVKEPYSAFVAHVKSTASAILFHRGKGRSSVNNMDENTAEEEYHEAINAVNRRFNRPGGGQRPRREAGPTSGRTSGPPRGPTGGPTDRPPRCPNCRGEHALADCKKPRVAIADRLCYTCGGKHMARNCPEHPKKRQEGGAVRAVEEPEHDADYCFAMCHGHLDHEGFKKVEHRSKGKPMPTKITMADFMPVPTPVSNSFDALKNSQNTEIKIAKNVVDVSSEVFHSPEADKR